MRCRICGYEGDLSDFEADFTNHLGYWCPCCDSFSYTSDEDEKRRLFLLWLEDVKHGHPLTERKKIRQNVSPLRYPGGKTKLLPYIASIIPKGTKRVVEPYCGGGSISLALLLSGMVQQIRLNDVQPGVSEMFKTIITDPEYIIRRLYDTKPDAEIYEQYRNEILQSSDGLDQKELGFRFLYCNRIAYSGIILGNAMTDPKSRYNPRTLAKRIAAIWEKRDCIEVTSDDALKVIEEEYWTGEQTLLFVDPPYRQKGPQLYPKAYTDEDHDNLCALVENLYREVSGANIIMTYDNDEYIKQLYEIPKTEIIKPVYSI